MHVGCRITLHLIGTAIAFDIKESHAQNEGLPCSLQKLACVSLFPQFFSHLFPTFLICSLWEICTIHNFSAVKTKAPKPTQIYSDYNYFIGKLTQAMKNMARAFYISFNINFACNINFNKCNTNNMVKKPCYPRTRLHLAVA